MSIGIDAKLTYNEDLGLYDITIDADGQLTAEDSFDNAILLSLFCDARADASQVTPPENRRGWWGNTLNEDGHEIGSLLWLLEQTRKRQKTINEAIDHARNALQWMVDDGYAQSIDINAVYTNNILLLSIKYLRPDNQVENKVYNLWEQTEVKERTRF